MKRVILTVADIPLSIEFKDVFFLPNSFRKFKTNNKKINNHSWCLEAVGIEEPKFFDPDKRCIVKKIELIKQKFHFFSQSSRLWDDKYNRLFYVYSRYPNMLSRLSFYFNDPVLINPKERKISYFYFKEQEPYKIKRFNSRLIAFAYSQILALNRGVLFHSSCVVKENQAFLFFAKPEGGKSTVAKLSKRYCILGDDIIAIRKINKEFLAFPTPWLQKAIINKINPLSAKIKAVFFLKKSKRIHFVPLRPEESLVKVLSQQIHFFLYTQRPLVRKIFFTMADLFRTIPAYQMYFRKDCDFWPALEKIVK